MKPFCGRGEHYNWQDVIDQLFVDDVPTIENSEHPVSEQRPNKGITTVRQLIDAYTQLRDVTPIEGLSLPGDVKRLGNHFDFVGLKWSSQFGFTVAFCPGDGLSKNQITERCHQFFELNNQIYRKPQKSLNINFVDWLIASTWSGVLCFVFENGYNEEEYQFIQEHRDEALTYRKSAFSVSLSVQTTATSHVWAVHLPDQRVDKHLGKRPFAVNYHIRKTHAEHKQLETQLNQILSH